MCGGGGGGGVKKGLIMAIYGETGGAPPSLKSYR